MHQGESKMEAEAIITALFCLYVITRARDYFEKRFDAALLLLEDQSSAETQVMENERVCVL